MTLALCLVTSTASAAALRHELGLGADYSNQRHTAYTSDTLESDTSDIETEAKGFWRLTLDNPESGTGPGGSNTLTFSTRSLADALYLSLDRDLLSRLILETDLDAEARWNHDLFPALADTFWRRDQLSGSASAGLRWNLAEQFDLNAADRVEAQYDLKPDSFNFNYVVNRIEAGASLEIGMLGSLDAAWYWSRRWAIAVDSQDYDDHSARLGFDNYFGENWQVHLANDLARRTYQAAERSYWDENLNLQLGFDFGSVFGLSVEEDARWTLHDSSTTVYSNQFENRLRPGFEWRPLTELTFRFGLQWEKLQTLPAPKPEDYRDRSVMLGFDLLKPDRFWLSLEDRLGQRTFESPDSGFQSDYRYNELYFMLNWTIFSAGSNSLTVDGMASISPEWHSDRTDNFYLTTYTLELKYGF